MSKQEQNFETGSETIIKGFTPINKWYLLITHVSPQCEGDKRDDILFLTTHKITS